MGLPAARMGDRVNGIDTHIIMIPSPGGPVPTPTPLPFAGTITDGCCQNVLIGGQPAAVTGSGATNNPPHMPTGGPFQNPPTNRGTVGKGSTSVLIGGKPAARSGDRVLTCADPAPALNGVIISTSTVLIG